MQHDKTKHIEVDKNIKEKLKKKLFALLVLVHRSSWQISLPKDFEDQSSIILSPSWEWKISSHQLKVVLESVPYCFIFLL